MGALNLTLYRAADDDYVDTQYSFARERDAAEAYRDNPGFGGSTLYVAAVVCDDDQVVDLRPLDRNGLLLALGLDHDPGAVTEAELLTRGEYLRCTEHLRSQGYVWAIIADSYPEGAETWVWLGTSCDDEPTLTAVSE